MRCPPRVRLRLQHRHAIGWFGSRGDRLGSELCVQSQLPLVACVPTVRLVIAAWVRPGPGSERFSSHQVFDERVSASQFSIRQAGVGGVRFGPCHGSSRLSKSNRQRYYRLSGQKCTYRIERIVASTPCERSFLDDFRNWPSALSGPTTPEAVIWSHNSMGWTSAASN